MQSTEPQGSHFILIPSPLKSYKIVSETVSSLINATGMET